MAVIILVLFAIFWILCGDKFEKGNAQDTITIWIVLIIIAVIAAVIGIATGAFD